MCTTTGEEGLDVEECELEEETKRNEERSKRKRRLERPGPLETSAKKHRLNNPDGVYTNSELQEVRTALEDRKKLLMFSHSQDVDESDIFERYLDRGRRETTRKKERIWTEDNVSKQRNRSLRRMREGRERKRQKAGPLCLQPNPVLTTKLCRACGGSHVARTLHCPIQRYHERCNVFGTEKTGRVSARFFVLWPCLMCNDVTHATPVCEILHGWCQACKRRGHSSDMCHDDRKRERFERFAPFGLYTQLAKGQEGHIWGFAPKFHRWSDAGIAEADENLVRHVDTLSADDIYETVQECRMWQ